MLLKIQKNKHKKLLIKLHIKLDKLKKMLKMLLKILRMLLIKEKLKLRLNTIYETNTTMIYTDF